MELVLRLLGFNAYQYESFYCTSDPKTYLVTDSVFGINTKPGVYKINLNGLQHKVSQTQQNLRSTVPFQENKNKIALYGCSFTYGTGVEDSNTVVSQLQQRTKSCQFINYGKPGWGTTQMFLQLKKMLKSGIEVSKVAVNFCDFHLARNGLSPSYRLTLSKGISDLETLEKRNANLDSFPYFSYEDSLQLNYESWKDLSTDFPGRNYSALMNLVQNVVSSLQEDQSYNYRLGIQLFIEMNKLCLENEVDFEVYGITESEITSRFIHDLKTKNIHSHYVPVPFHEEQYNLSPLDLHPNKEGYGVLADQMMKTILL